VGKGYWEFQYSYRASSTKLINCAAVIGEIESVTWHNMLTGMANSVPQTISGTCVPDPKR
jgi:hypothetical protein